MAKKFQGLWGDQNKKKSGMSFKMQNITITLQL